MKKIILSILFVLIYASLSQAATVYPRTDAAYKASSGGYVLVSSRAQVWVYLSGTSTLATLYLNSAGTTTTPNPVVADASGNYQYYTTAGFYDEVIVGPVGTSPVSRSGVGIGLISNNIVMGVEHNSDGTHSSIPAGIQRLGTAFFASHYPSLNAVHTAASATSYSVIILDGWYVNLTSNLTTTVPIIWNGGVISCGTNTITIGGSFTAGMSRAFDATCTAGDVSFGKSSVREVYPQWFGAFGNGTVDDSDAIQNAVSSVSTFGGTVYFPVPGRYMVTKQINVSSTNSINLKSDMAGSSNNIDETGSYISIGGTWAGSVFKYYTPTATRSDAGGGNISGLVFFDTTGNYSGSGYSITAALELTDFNFSNVFNCSFIGLKGSAIKTVFTVMSNFDRLIVRSCGDVGKPAFYIVPDNVTFTTQSTSIGNSKFEANRDAAYISVGQFSQNLKIIGNGFEAVAADANTNQVFVSFDGSASSVSDNHYNDNTAVQVVLGINTQEVQITNSTFRGQGTTAAITMSGFNNIVNACSFTSTKTADEITMTGQFSTVSNCSFYNGGGVTMGGNFNKFTSNTMYILKTTNPYWIIVAGDGMVVSNNILRGDGATGSSGGIRITGTFPVISSNSLYLLTGDGIRNETSNAIVLGNGVLSSATGTDFNNTIDSPGIDLVNNYFLSAPGMTLTAPTTTILRVGYRSHNLYPAKGDPTEWTFSSSGVWEPTAQAGVLLSITSNPSFTGQFAVVGVDAYVSVGTSTTGDWKKITP